MLGLGQTEKGDRRREKSRACSSFSLTTRRGLFATIVPADQSYPHTTVTFYGHCVKIHPELWRQKNWLLYHDNALSDTPFLHQGIFLPKAT
jgi:hypothetical protein